MTENKSDLKKPRGVIIGFGNIAALGHLPAYHELGVDIVATIDICQKRRDRSEALGIEAFSSLEKLGGLEIDFIDICTPPSYRYEPIAFAVEKGLDVICEKPVSTPRELTQIKNITRDSDIFFFPIHNWKYAPQYVKTREMVDENGGIDNLTMTTMRTHFGTGTPDWNPDWRVNPLISGGGIIMDHGYHNIYLAMHLFGCEFTNAVLEDVEYFTDNPEIEKRACFSLEFPDEKKASITLDWEAGKREIKNTLYECNHTIELSDKQIIGQEHIFEFDRSLSGDSVHSAWFRDVISDFLEQRKTRDKRFFLEAIKVLEGIDSLYKQAAG